VAYSVLNERNFVHRSCRGRPYVVSIGCVMIQPLTTRGWLLRHYDPVSPGAARGHAAASEHQGVSLMGLGKWVRLRVDQPTITG
jgi:hypothetical protein